MWRIEFWSRSLPRAELDQRSRDARLRLEQLERLLVSRARASLLRRRRFVSFGVGRHIRALREHRAAAPPYDQRPSRMPFMSFG
jgi:hypothetical protein